MNFPVFSQLAGNLAFRDEFARDCLLQQGVCKNPTVWTLATSRPALRRSNYSNMCDAGHTSLAV